jgi:phage protein D
MLTPGYKVTLGQRAFDTTQDPRTSTAVDITVELDLETPIDSAVVRLGRVGTLNPAVDDALAVELGYADETSGLVKVITASVVELDQGSLTNRVTGYTAANALQRTYVDRSYESKTAGQIVRDLAGEGKVAVAVADDGILFPSYVVDRQRGAYAHMRELASLCGFDVYLNADGQLVFEKFYGGKAVHVFENAKHVVALDVFRSQPLAGSVVAWGESPTGSQGDNAWPWLTNDFSGSKGTAGSGDPVLLLERPALRTSAAAQTAADALELEIKRRTLRGRVLTIGRPEVKLGDAIVLRGMADASLNTTFQVRSVRHRMSKTDGFTTLVGFRAIAV